MNKITVLCLSAFTLLIAACSTSQHVAPSSCCQHDNDSDYTVILASVPATALDAAKKSVPRFQPSCAKLKHTNVGDVYEIKGTSNKRKYEIDVTTTGRVLEIDRD